MVHLYFNIIGSLLFVLVFYGIGLFHPWDFLGDTCSEMNIAVIHTSFNVCVTALLLPLNGLLVKLATLSVPDGKQEEKPVLLDERLLATPAVAIQRSQDIAARMAEDSAQAMRLAMGLIQKFDRKSLDRVLELENNTDRYEDALGTYLVQLSSRSLSVADSRILNTLLYTISDVERIADHAVNVGKAALEMEEKKIVFSQQAQGELEVLERAISDILGRTVEAYWSLRSRWWMLWCGKSSPGTSVGSGRALAAWSTASCWKTFSPPSSGRQTTAPMWRWRFCRCLRANWRPMSI